MKKGTLFTKLTLLCAGLLFFASCSDLFGFQEGSSSVRNGGNGKVIFNGSICVTGALPASLNEICHAELDSASINSSSRSALPSFTIGTEYYYYVTATQTDGSGSFSITNIEDSDFFDFSSGVTFALELTSGKWNIEAGIKNDDASVMSETYPATVSTANPVVSHTFYPKPLQKGSGTLSLTMSIPDTVKSVTATCSDDGWNVTCGLTSETLAYVKGGDGTDGAAVDSGSYEVTFNFYGNDSILLYSTVQTVNVFDNLLTNTWVSDGSGIINESGDFSLTSALITQFARTTFYVGQTAAATKLKITASDTSGTGSVYSPLETVTKAVEVIAATGNSSNGYRIFVSGTVMGAQEISDAVNGKAKSITIQGYNGLDSSGEPKDALSCSGSTDAVTLKVSSTVPVTLKNIKLLGDSTPTSKTMVLVLDNDYETDVTIEEGVWITGNDTSSFTEENFSAVFVGVDGKLTMKGGKISGNKCMSGGGIVVGGTFVMTGGEISGNEATAFGGGVYNVGSMFMYGSAVIGDATKTTAATESNYSNKAGEKGGGIYSTGNLYLGYSSWTSESENTPASLTGGVFYNFSPDVGGIFQYADNTSYLFKMNSGSVSYNAGRGIYVGKCTLTMTGGTVKGNTAIKGSDSNTEYQLNGAGLYAGTGATITVSGGTITENHAKENGGGLYTAQNDSIIILEGGTISSNTADGKGNGIAIANGYLKMKGNASVDSNNDVFLASGKVITVTGELTGTSPVATITPAAWTRGTTIVQADGTNLTTLKDGEYDYTNYFAISDADWVTKLSTDNKSLMIDAPIYVAESGKDETGDGTKGAPFATIAKACTEMKDKNTEFTIFIDGEVTGTQTIPDTLKSDGTGSYNAKSVILSGATGNTSDILNGNSQGTTLMISTAVPVTIKNLKITGGSATYGGGIYLGSDSNVTLSESIVTNNKSTGYGGGIAVYCASLIIDKSTITENRTTTETLGVGGGIALVGSDTVTAKVTMKADSVISGNKTYANKNGGGVALYIGKTQFTMEGGEISGNTAYSGGGVYMCNNAEFILKDGKISGNKATHSSGTVGGGGIYFCNQASLAMSGGEISGNEAKDFGGGVAFAADEKTPTFTMTGGVIKNNTIKNTSGLGKGVSVNGTFNMSGNALVDSTNDVYLESGKTITITDSLTGTPPVATITPASYGVGTTVLAAGPDVTLADEVEKFALTPYASDPTAGWFITSEGILGTPLNAEQVTSENYDTVTRIKVTSAAGMNQIAILSSANGKTFEGKTIILFDDVTLTSSFTPIGGESYTTAFKGTFDGNNKTVSGLSGQKALFNYVGDNNVGGTVKALTVEGSSTYAGIVNKLNSGRIEGCRSYVSVTHTGGSDTGGIAAFCNTGTIINCVNYGTVKSSGNRLGGILGSMQGGCVVDSCVNKGTVQSTGANKTGGIVGHVFGTVRNCINIGEVSASTTVVGGIVGDEDCSGTDRGVLNCANLAPVSGTYRVGGIAGACDLSNTDDNYNAIVKNCFNAESVTITDTTQTSVGGVIGEILTGGSGTCTLVNNYYSKTGTAASGIGVTNDVSVENPSAMVPSIYQMNAWVNDNNSESLYKIWTVKNIDGEDYPVPDIGYDW